MLSPPSGGEDLLQYSLGHNITRGDANTTSTEARPNAGVALPICLRIQSWLYKCMQVIIHRGLIYMPWMMLDFLNMALVFTITSLGHQILLSWPFFLWCGEVVLMTFCTALNDKNLYRVDLTENATLLSNNFLKVKLILRQWQCLKSILTCNEWSIYSYYWPQDCSRNIVTPHDGCLMIISIQILPQSEVLYLCHTKLTGWIWNHLYTDPLPYSA